jgi:hypothetical protein
VRAVERHIDTKVAELHAYGLIKKGDSLEARIELSRDENGDVEMDYAGNPRSEVVFYRIPRPDEVGKGKRRGRAVKTQIRVRY